MSTSKRLLWVVLLLTVVAALWPVAENDTADSVATRPARGRNRSSAPDSSAAPELRALTASGAGREREIVDLFPRQGFTPPAVAAAPEKPAAPALPFSYGGRYTEGNKVFVFLSEGAKMHTVRQGDTVNATYRIEKIDAAAITLTYLPLGQQQTLQTGSAARR